jgi:hypothetical protein
MFLSTFLSRLESVGHPSTQGKVRLAGELLESRCVPAAPADFLWACPRSDGGLWSTFGNWGMWEPTLGRWVDATRLPGEEVGDTVAFGGRPGGTIAPP